MGIMQPDRFPADPLSDGSTPAINEAALDLDGTAPLFPAGFNPLHEGQGVTMRVLTDILHAEQRRTGALSLFGMCGRIAAELTGRAEVDIRSRGLAFHSDGWLSLFYDVVSNHMREMWPSFAVHDERDAPRPKPERQPIPADVVSISDLRAEREAAREAARAVAYTTGAAGSTGRQQASR